MSAGRDGAKRRQGMGRFLPRTTARRYLPYFLTATGLFLAAAVLGAAADVGRGASPVLPVVERVPTSFEGSVGYFFGHNLQVALLTASGVLLITLPTLVLLAYNGFALGGVFAEAVGNFGPVAAGALLLPHGVIELPAIWLAGAISLRWGHAIWRVSTGDGLKTPLLGHLAQSGLALAGVVLLLAVAAWVEATLTPVVAGAVP